MNAKMTKKIKSTLCLKNVVSTSHYLWKTSLHYLVKHESLKCIRSTNFDDKAVNFTINFFKYLKKHITLLTYYLLPCPATRVPITSSQS